MEELENTIPTPGIEPGVPSNFEGSSISGSLQPGFNQLVPYDPTLSVPGIPGSVEIQYDPNNPFDVAKQAKAAPITEGDIAFQRSKGKFFQPGFEKSNFERYYDDEDNFYKLGFDPNINNEQIYNQNRSWYEDVFRSAAAVPALGISVVKSSYRSLGDMLSGDFSMTDETGAREFSQIMAESGSTRGGVSGFASNLILQSGFIAGIAADYLATEALLTGAVALSEGAALPAAVAAGTAKTAQTVKSISALFDANTARQAYNTIKAIDAAKIAQGALNLSKSAAEALIPKTLVNIKGILTAESPVIGLANTVRGVGDFVLDMKQISYATSESALEGGQVKNDFIDRHINEYIENNGKYPDQTELDRIYQLASDAGTTTGLINAPLILLTNAVTFDNLFKGGKKNLITGSDAAILEEAKLSGKVTRFVERTGKFETMTAKDAFVESIRGLKSPKTYASFAKSYFSKNLTEGLQELSQEIVAGASEDYYDRIYDTPEAGGIVSYLADAYENLKNQASAQGAEVFLSGFLMGGLAGIATGAARGGFNTLKRNYLSARNPEEYKKAVQEEDERINKIASELNDAIQNGNKIFSEPDLENLLVQVKLGEDMVKARKSFDEKVFHDLKDMSRFNSVYTALQTNKFDFVIKKIEDMKQMTGAELKQAFGLADSVTDEEARKVLDVTIDRAYQVKEQYEQFSGYKNPFNPNKYFPNTPEGNTQKIQELINFKGFEEAKKTAVFSLHGLEQAKKRMSDLTKSYATIASVAELNYSDVAATLSMDSIDNEINLLNAEIEMSKDTTDPALTKTINNKKKKLKALESLKKNLERVKDVTDPTEVRKTTYLKKAFTDYMTVLTEEKGTFLTPKDINEAYRIFTDYYALNKDKADFTNLLSSLYDPENFANLVQRESLLVAARSKNFKDYFTKAFKKYSETSKVGLFLKDLAKTGFVIDLKYLKELDENNFNGLKKAILNDPDIKFRDLNSNKLFGVDDVRYNTIKSFVDKFENSVKPDSEVKPTATEAGPANSYGTQSTDDIEEGTEDIEYASDFTNNILRRLYDDYLKSLKEADIPVSFEEFVSSKKANSVMSAISELENAYDNIVDSTKPPFEEWLRINARTPIVFDVLDKNNLTFSDISIQKRDENQYITTSLEEGESVVSQGYNGVFITKVTATAVEGSEGVDIYFVKVNDGTLAIDAAGKPNELLNFDFDFYEDLTKAEKAQKAIGDYLANNKKQFIFDNVPLVNGQIISDTKNNEYIVLSYPSEIAAGSNLKLKNVKTGAILPPVKSFQGFKLERAPIEKKAYTSRFNSTSIIDKAWGKRNKEANESQEAANIRLSNFLRDTPAEDLLNNLSIRFSNNNKSPERYAYLKVGEEKENFSFGFFTDPYTIALVYNGEEIGYLPNPTSTAFLDSQGNPIPYDRINADRVKQVFYLKSGAYNQAVADIKSSYKNKIALLNYLKSKLGKDTSVEIPYSDLKKVANINIGLGSYEFLSRDEERPKFSQVNYNTINGGIYVIDRKIKYKNGSVTTEEGSPITDIDIDSLESTIKEVNDARYNKKGADALLKYGRYVAAVKLPNGKIRFVELTTSSLSNEELNSLANSIKERIELTKKENLNEDGTPKAQEYNDIWNEENIGDKLFIALPLKDRGKFLDIYVSPNGSLVLDFVNKNSRTSPIQRKKIIDNPDFNDFPGLLSLINNAIKEHDNQAKNPINKMDIALTGKSFKATLPKSIDTTQVLEMESSVGVNVVKDISVYVDMLEQASDVQAQPILPKTPDEILDVDISNIDFSSAPATANINPELLRGVAPVNPPVAPAQPTNVKADIEKTLYGTIAGSIPLSQALPNGVYIDLDNGLFAYVDKNEKIAAIVDKNNNYLLSKSFWNATKNAWQLPNKANLEDNAKKLGVDVVTYIKKYQDAVDSLNAKADAGLVALEQPTNVKADIERIEIPRYFRFGELGGKPGKKAGETIESEKNREIQNNFEKQLKEGDRLIEPNGDVFFYKNGKIVKSNGQQRGIKDIGAFLNGVTIERNTELATLEKPKEPVQVSSAETLNKLINAQKSIPQQIKQLQAQADSKTDEVRKVLLAQRLAEKGELTVADKREIRTQAENSPEVLAIKGQIEVLEKSIGLKVVDAGYTESDITNLTEFLNWVENNLPDFISVEDLKTFKNNLYKEGKTVGAFISSLSNVAGNVEVNGIIYTSASSPFKYHEAFHAVFRLLLNDKQISRYLAIAKKELRDQLRKEGKSFSLAKEEMRLLHPLYAGMSESQLEERMYEEYLADKFEAWKKNNKTETSHVNKSLFAKIVELIKKLFSRFTKNELQSLFESIDAGKYRNSKVVTNRFTDSPFDISEPVLKAIKIGTEVIEDSTFAAEGESNLIKVDKYLPEQEGTRLAASVAAIYNNKLKDADKQTNTDELLDSVLNSYEELYDPDLEQYADLDTPVLNKLKEYKAIFSKTENREILKEAVREHLAILSIKENNEQDVSDDATDELGERGKQNYTEGAASVGGFGSLSKFLRSFISTVTYQATDDFGNTQFLDGTPYIQSVDGSTVYNGILKAIAGSEDIYEIIEKLNLFKEKNFESGKVIQEFFNETGITFDDEGNADLSNVKNSYLFQSFIKGFGQYAVDYLFINKDLKKQIALIISANRKDAGKVQFDQWSQAYASVYESKVTPELKGKAKLVLTGIKSAMSPTKKYTDDELIVQTNKLSTALMENLGISLSPMYLAYSISNNLNTSNLTPHQLKLITLYSGASPITIEDIDILSGLIDSGENPFINLQYETTINPETGEVVEETEILEGGATTRLYNIAKVNAIFDESVYATSWKNAEGQLVYVHQLPSYHLVKINEIKKTGGIEELLKDPFLENNYLLKNPKFLASLDLITVKRIDGQKVSSLTETGEGEAIENKELEVNRREGTTYGSFSPEEFITSLIDLYSEGGVQKRGGLEFGTSTHLIRVLEASSTGNVVNLPVIKAAAKVSGKNTLSDEAKNAILGFVEQEYNRIQRVANGEFTDEIYDFNTGKMRGLTLFKTGKLLSEDFKNELEAQAQENLPLTESQKTQIKNEATKSMLDDVNFLLELLDQDNILKVEDGKVQRSALSGFVTKGFTNKDKKKSADKTKNSVYNLLKDDYKFNLLQIYVNDFINTTAINQLMHGDHAISFKDPVDEIKRAKGSNATGANIESVITDERLGIKHEFKTAHVVTISDPKFTAKFAGGKKDKADAQMWMTVKALRYTLFGLGKLSPIQAELLNKIENGEEVTGDFFFGDKKTKGAVSFNAATNSIKLVYFDGQTYVKTSGFVLTKEFTSYGKNFDKALPGKEELHKLRQTLEAYEADKETVSLAVPTSASKGKKINVVSDINSITDSNFIETKTKYWRLQLENPSNKVVITDPTQPKQILTAEQDDETIVNFMGKDITVGDLKKIYQDASINRVKVNYLGKRNAIFTLDSGLEEVKRSIAAGSVTPKLAAFQKYAIETLRSSAGDAQMIEFFELDEQGEPKYDLNSPITIDKFVELFLSYFSKGVLSEKVPGHAVALVSDYGVKQLKKVLELDENGQPKRWEIVRVEEFKLNPSKYGTPKEYSDPENRTFTGLKVDDYYIDDLRHNVPEYDKDGNITGYFTEFIMPAHFKELLSFIKPGDKIPDVVAKMFGARIPSQDKHSAVALKLVDFMPVYYGSSAIFPQELIEISGADFDIDKLYIVIQEWLVENGKFKAYGTGTSKTERFNQFVKYQFSKNKEFRKSYSEFYNALKKERADEIEALQDLDIDVSDSDLFDTYIDKKEVVKAALQSLGLPSTADEYNNKVQKLGYEPYQGALNNIIVNDRIALLNNSAMVTAKEGEIPKAFQVATVQPLINIVKSFTERFPELKDQLEEGKYNVDNLLGKYYAFRNNKEGARNIGPAVNALLVYSLLNTNNITIRKARFFIDENGDEIELGNLRFKLNGKEFDNYAETKAYNPETGKYDGERIFYILSALTSAMTDNAKERLAAKLNLNINSLGIVANMIAQGVSLEDSLLFINQPAIREFYKRLQKNKSSYAEEKDRMKGQAKIIGELLEEYSIKDVPSDISTEDLEQGIRTNNANIQAAVLNSFKTLIAQSEAFMNVSAILKVNKGLPKDLTEFDEIYNKAVDLGIEMNDKEFENSNIPFDIRRLLNSSNNTFGFNFTVYREIKSLMGSVMLNRTPVVNRMREIIIANTEVNSKDRKNFNKSLDQNLLSFFAIKAYVNLLKTGGYKRALASLNNGIVYDQTASTLPDNMENVTDVVNNLRKLAPKNYFVNKFLFAITAANRSNKDGINKVEFNNWTKLSKLQLNKIQYSFMELYNNEITRPYAIDLFHYLLVKDGGQFKSGSFIRIMPNFMFDLILKSSSSAVMALKGKANDTIVKKTFGANLNQLYNEFVRGYLQNTNTTFFTKTVKDISKNNQIKEFKQELGIKGDVSSPIVKSDDKILINVFKNTSFEREMIPLGDVSNYKGDEFIVDENGQYQVVQPMLSLPGPSKLTEEGKKMYRYNLKYLRASGFVLQTKNDKTQIGFPLVVKSVQYVMGNRNTVYYKLTSIKRDRTEEKENLADLIQPGDMYAFGVSAEYEKFTPIGSKKQFAAGFVIPGNIPSRTDVFKDRKNKNVTSNPNGIPDLNNIDFDQGIEKQLSNVDFSSAPANISNTLASNNISFKTEGKKIVYEKDGKPFETTAKSPEELAKSLTPKTTEETLDNIDQLVTAAPPMAFDPSIGANIKAQAEYPVLNNFYTEQLSDEERNKIREGMGIKTFVNFVQQYKEFVNTIGGDQNSFVEQIKKCYL